MINRFRRRFSFKQRDRDIVVSNRDATSEFKLFFQTQSILKPFHALLRIAHSQSKVANFSERERNLHLGGDVVAESVSNAMAARISRGPKAWRPKSLGFHPC